MNRSRIWLACAALVGLFFVILVAVGTVAASRPVFPDWIVFPLFLFTFVVFGGALLHARRYDVDTPRPFAHLRPILRHTLTLVLACMLVIAAVSFFQMGGGNPERDGDRYFLRNHNDLIPISRRDYVHAVGASQRAFSTIAGVFLVLALGLGLAGGGRADNGPETHLPRKARLRPQAPG